MSKDQLLYLSKEDVESVRLPMTEIIDAVERAFLLKGQGLVEMPPKPGIHPREDAFIHAMPAYIKEMEAAGVKWVSGYPQNQSKGLPYISGLIILNDTETGIPRSVMDCTWITAMRTGAATAVAAKYMARPESKTLGILGCGVQGRSNLLALKECFSLDTVFAYDTNIDCVARFANEMSKSTGLQIEIASKPREAVTPCDLIVTAGPILKQPHATIQKDWMMPGAFASPVDFDSYWHPDALRQADIYSTDDTSQYFYYQKAGYFQNVPDLQSDLGEIVNGTKPGRKSPEERTICINLGLAIEDMAVAPLVYNRAKEHKIGTWLSL